MLVKKVDINSIFQDPSNVRKHPAKNLEAIKGSLKKFGQVEPLLVNSKNKIIIGGNGRHAAMIDLGFKQVDIVEIDLDKIDATALSLALNRTAELAEWDKDLGKILQELYEEDFGLDEIGFDLSDLDDFGVTDKEKEAIEDDVPEPQKDIWVKPGDLFKLGDHRVLCGDSTKKEDVERLMAGEKADMVFTDPPYGVNYDPTWRAERGPGDIKKDNMSPIQNDHNACWSDVWRMFNSDVIYCWCASLKSDEVKKSLENCGYEIHSLIIWRKIGSVLTRCHYHWLHEPCWYAYKNKSHWVGDKKQTTVWEATTMNSYANKDEHTGHGSQKPVVLGEIAIKNHDCKNIADPFLGSGSTLIACEKTGRRCYGIEIDCSYVSVIIDRYIKYVGSDKEVYLIDGEKRTHISEVRNMRKNV